MSDRPAVRAALDEAIASHDRPAAVRVALDAVESGSISIIDLYAELSSLLIDLGDAWRRGTAEVWQEHFASGVVRTIVEVCSHRVELDAGPDRTAVVVLAAPADEYHDLGLRMLADRFALAGWRPQFLGANVPVSEVIAAASELHADAIALSASTHFHRLALRQYVDAIAGALPDARVWVGGPAFAHEHDGWNDDDVLDPTAIPAPGRS